MCYFASDEESPMVLIECKMKTFCITQECEIPAILGYKEHPRHFRWKKISQKCARIPLVIVARASRSRRKARAQYLSYCRYSCTLLGGSRCSWTADNIHTPKLSRFWSLPRAAPKGQAADVLNKN